MGSRRSEMKIYDTYAGVQVKIGTCEMNCYEIGDDVPLPDGVYVGYEGFFVVHNNKLLCLHSQITTKWGEKILPVSILKSRMASFIEEMRANND